jgi:hypothetical protein
MNKGFKRLAAAQAPVDAQRFHLTAHAGPRTDRIRKAFAMAYA